MPHNLPGCLLILLFLAAFWGLVFFSGLGPLVLAWVWSASLWLLGEILHAISNIVLSLWEELQRYLKERAHA